MSEERSGRILLRLPRSLHGMLAAAAEREGVRLNQFVVAVRAGSVGWMQSGQRSTTGDATSARSGTMTA